VRILDSVAQRVKIGCRPFKRMLTGGPFEIELLEVAPISESCKRPQRPNESGRKMNKSATNDVAITRRNAPLALLSEGGWREFVTVTLLSAVLNGLAFCFTRRLDASAPEFELPWNHHKYAYMAEGHAFDFHIQPFCWRVLEPLLVQLLPLPTQTGFLVVCFFMLVGTATLVYYIAKEMAWPEPYPLLALLLFFVPTWVCRQLAFDFWNVDALAFFLLALAVWAAVTRRTILFAVALALGVATKETVVCVAPMFYSLNADRLVDGPWLRRSILAVAPAAAVLIAIRTLIPAWNNDPQYVALVGAQLAHVVGGKTTYSFSDFFWEVGVPRLRHLSLSYIREMTVYTWGILFILPLLALRGNAKLCLRLAPFILIAYVQVLVALDTPRLLAIAFIPFILMSLNGIRAIAEAGSVAPLRFAALPLSIFALSMTDRNFNLPFDMEVIVFSALVGILWWPRCSNSLTARSPVG
jgi:hypothetical protein